jgi:methyl-accepting chemotaxis protein
METRIRRMLEEALRKDEELAKERTTDFWAGKTFCWQMCHCPPAIKDECPASKFTFLPCWEIEGTYCKLQKNGDIVTGTDTSICEVCRVYKKYGGGRPIELKLLGKGLNTSIETK